MDVRPTLVSIIIPAYNAGSFIEETINSVYCQTYKSWEIIVVNDGSTDNTNNILRSFHDLRIRIVNQQYSGMIAARYRGLEMARGKFVVFLEAYDEVSPDFLANRVEAIQLDNSLGYTDDNNFAGVPSGFMFRKSAGMLFHLRPAVSKFTEQVVKSFIHHPLYFIGNFVKRITTFRSARVIRMNG